MMMMMMMMMMMAIPFPNIKHHQATMGWGFSTPTPSQKPHHAETWEVFHLDTWGLLKRTVAHGKYYKP